MREAIMKIQAIIEYYGMKHMFSGRSGFGIEDNLSKVVAQSVFWSHQFNITDNFISLISINRITGQQHIAFPVEIQNIHKVISKVSEIEGG